MATNKEHSNLQSMAGMELKVKLDNCRKRTIEKLPVRVCTTCKDEFSNISPKGWRGWVYYLRPTDSFQVMAV
jgi:hypothetical protein